MTIASPTPLNYRSYTVKAKAFWNEIAIAYSCLGYTVGIALLFVANNWLNILGVILTSS